MKNVEIAAALSELADLLEIASENVFRVRAYRRAAETIAGMAEPVGQVLARDAQGVPGIGAGIKPGLFKNGDALVETVAKL